MNADDLAAPEPLAAPPPRRPRLAVHFVVICLLAAVFGAVTVYIVRPLVVPLFLAVVFAILAAPVHERLAPRVGGRWVASGLLTLLLMLAAVGFPAVFAFLAFSQSEALIEALGGPGADPLREWPGHDPPPQLEPAIAWVTATTSIPEPAVRTALLQAATQLREVFYTRAGGFIGTLPELLMGLGVFVVALFFFLADGARMQESWEALTPLPVGHDRLLRRDFARVCRGLIAATLLASLAQAATFALGLLVIEWVWNPGIGWWLFPLTMACWVCSLIPFIGAWVVWLPTAVGLLWAGYPVAAVALAVYGSGIVSQVDNLIRMWVLHDTARMHPLLGFVTILGGIQVFGVFGLFLAPVVAAVTVTLLRILRAETVRVAARIGVGNGGAGGPNGGSVTTDRTASATTAASAPAAGDRPVTADTIPAPCERSASPSDAERSG